MARRGLEKSLGPQSGAYSPTAHTPQGPRMEKCSFTGLKKTSHPFDTMTCTYIEEELKMTAMVTTGACRPAVCLQRGAVAHIHGGGPLRCVHAREPRTRVTYTAEVLRGRLRSSPGSTSLVTTSPAAGGTSVWYMGRDGKGTAPRSHFHWLGSSSSKEEGQRQNPGDPGALTPSPVLIPTCPVGWTRKAQLCKGKIGLCFT